MRCARLQWGVSHPRAWLRTRSGLGCGPAGYHGFSNVIQSACVAPSASTLNSEEEK
jgi:hypothetical protein